MYVLTVKRAAKKFLLLLRKLRVKLKVMYVENLLEDSDTEFIAEEEIPDTNEDTHQLLTSEAVVHVESESNESEPPPKKKLKAKIAELKWKRQPKFIKTRKCNLEGKIL